MHRSHSQISHAYLEKTDPATLSFLQFAPDGGKHNNVEKPIGKLTFLPITFLLSC
jgi:hypothetical protein